MRENGWENREADSLFQEGSSLQNKRDRKIGEIELMVGH